MVLIPVKCPVCQSAEVVKYGKQPNGEQRYRCDNSECDRTTFLLNYTNKGNQPGTKEKVIEMASNGSGIRDTARVLKISPGTVMSVLKKQNPSYSRSTPRC